ncbi:MAG: 3-hydroxyacyl-CoA dehydrogenase [Beijerinckiaceae bacterium]
MSPNPNIAVIGAGSIGVAWAIVFARGGCAVRLQDPDAARRAAAPAEIAEKLAMLASGGLLDEPIDAVGARISVTGDLAGALADADHVQENAPEKLEIKQALFAEFARLAPTRATFASSSSFIPASRFAPERARDRCLVAHPGNPPFLIPVVEIVPTPATAEAASARVEALMTSCGMTPVRVRKEVEGFVFNRLQGAMLREAYCLVRDGVISASELDDVVRLGLGLRWSVVGPFETSDLNTRGGIAAHAERMGPSYARMGAERGQNDPWTPDLVAQVESDRRAKLPLHRWDARIAWRDAALLKMAAAQRRLPEFDDDTP